MRSIELSDAEWKERAASIELPAGLKDWVMLQIGRGQEYYSARLQRLGLRGGKVLDAGCGMGNWSIGLARWFEEVHALEVDPVRLDVLERMCDRIPGRIHTRIGSIESLPYEADSFDAVFCNGVIFLTDVERSLREFARVLKPGGVLYFTFNSKAWWLHLIFDRGPAEPECLEFGCNGILDLWFRNLDRLRFENRVPDSERRRLGNLLLDQTGGKRNWMRSRGRQLEEAFAKYRSSKATTIEFDGELKSSVRYVLRACFDGSDLAPMVPDLMEMLDVMERYAPPTHMQRLLRDTASRVLFRRSEYQLDYNTRSFEPQEMSALLGRIGFRRVLVSLEGSLQLESVDVSAPAIYGSNMGVYEALTIAPIKELKRDREDP